MTAVRDIVRDLVKNWIRDNRISEEATTEEVDALIEAADDAQAIFNATLNGGDPDGRLKPEVWLRKYGFWDKNRFNTTKAE